MSDTFDETTAVDEAAPIQEARHWEDETWIAQVIKNEDDDGWAVSMTLRGEAEPALIGPWTMGRDKKNPKPLDAPAFHTLVKTAHEVRRRHEQQLQARLHRQVSIATEAGAFVVTLDIVPDDDEPYATLAARDADGQEVARKRVDAGFRLTADSAAAWLARELA
ncbi:hypothetical protein [Rhizobacter sp. SG703]|uniref:hypothetical protein n=1 Tax=Rhizobacter sp. SG703 TaxID=2587140 RepID=UPI0014453350|nr:hypothetical protein [Rhizobacter sp. SG703]NKI95486.1 hypothetical protein [Rhizobacter sp. SG703]